MGMLLQNLLGIAFLRKKYQTRLSFTKKSLGLNGPILMKFTLFFILEDFLSNTLLSGGNVVVHFFGTLSIFKMEKISGNEFKYRDGRLIC
jgi:hypothetical protein